MDEIILKRCSKCRIEKPLDLFAKDNSNKTGGLRNQCKQCDKEYRDTHKREQAEYNARYRQEHRQELSEYHTEYSVIYYRENKGKRTKQHNEWRLQNRDKTRVQDSHRRGLENDAEGTHTAQELADLWIEQDGKCAYCECDLTETKKHIDHILPLVQGGSNWIINLAWACQTCNLSKSDKSPEEWTAYIG